MELTCFALTFTFKSKIDIVLVDEHKCQKLDGLDFEAQLEPFYGKIKMRLSQQKVCQELLKGRHAQLATSDIRNDVFYSAPCGYGKSLSFVAVASILGGITVRF